LAIAAASVSRKLISLEARRDAQSGSLIRAPVVLDGTTHAPVAALVQSVSAHSRADGRVATRE
jgi:hypothetical protein